MRSASQLALLLFTAPGFAAAACFEADYSVRTEYERADAIVTGVVVSAQIQPNKEDSDPESFDGVYYKIQVTRSYRGPFRSTVTIYSDNSSGRFPMEIGSGYLLFLRSNHHYLSANNCGNSGLLIDSAKVVSSVEQLQRSK